MSDSREPDGDAAFDGCAFHEWTSLADLAPYLSSAWKQVLLKAGDPTGPSIARPPALYQDPRGAKDPLATPAGGTAGSSYELLAAQLLAGGRRTRVVLGHDESLLATAFLVPGATRAVVRAANDWTIDRWLDRDERLLGLALVTASQPDEAAAEIRRVGSHRQIAGVAIGANGLGLPFGHHVYAPIHEAAGELGLPIVIQRGSDLAANLTVPPMAGGLAATYGEYRTLCFQPASSHLTSLIVNGVFERWRTLQVLLVGTGATWVPAFLWRLNYWFKMERREVPWLRQQPSDYFRDHVRIATNSLERPRPPRRLERMLAPLPWFERTLVYASGYPDRDWEEPDSVADRLPAAWRDRVLRQNAAGLFRLPGAGPDGRSG